MSKEDLVPKTFRALVESAERKFARVRDAPLHPYGGSGPQYGHFYHKVFKAYMRLWKYQQENRAKLMESGLQRWEIGEIASRIGQLYFNQYLRTSEARFLLEAYIFYEAIFHRKYFEGSAKDRGVRFKELRFYARFLMVSLILNRTEMVKLLVEKFKELVDDSKVNFRETNFKEWKLVVQEIVRFTKADPAFMNARPLRYTAMFDSYPASLPYVARFHAKRLLKFRDALLTSYRKNEVKFAELTLDTFRMLQCLEWEPTGSFYQKHPVESRENGVLADNSITSGLIDINLMADMTDPNLPPNPKKAVLYRPSVTQLIAVSAGNLT
ncbi:UNVERIFIED_CONTAM: protein SCAI [Sesamum radiatum]|uniref:Protein SCAI n=1 Tax=Sesamum radiatum TaxID=300843 RepID=A0AAW2RFH7_SESRA